MLGPGKGRRGAIGELRSKYDFNPVKARVQVHKIALLEYSARHPLRSLRGCYRQVMCSSYVIRDGYTILVSGRVQVVR
jgi:hypothetical protein